MKYFCFGDYLPSRPVEGVAVAGGLSGIHQAVLNYTEIGDRVICPDWFWGPYAGVMTDNYRELATFNFFKDRQFDMDSFAELVEDVAGKQNSLFLIFNSPANNPTGYSLSGTEWDDIFTYLNTIDRNIVLFLDTAYLDYSDVEDKGLFQKLDTLDAHVLPIVCYSVSKSFAKYGMRTAALMAVHEEETVLKEFSDIITISNRACFGSVNSIGQLMAMAIYEDKSLLREYFDEFDFWKTKLKRRADAFMQAIDHSIATPYKNGFFVSIYSGNPMDDVEALMQENIFLVPMKKGIRVGICSIEEDRMEALATVLNRVITG